MVLPELIISQTVRYTTRCPGKKKILVARVFSLQRQVTYQIKAKRLNYIIKFNFNYFIEFQKALKSVSPKISRIGRQKRKNEFFLIWPKEPIWLPVFGNDIKRFDFLFFSSKFAKLENSATRPSAAAMRLEI